MRSAQFKIEDKIRQQTFVMAQLKWLALSKQSLVREKMGKDVFVEKKTSGIFLYVSGIFVTDIVIEEWHLFVLLANGLGSEKNTLTDLDGLPIVGNWVLESTR